MAANQLAAQRFERRHLRLGERAVAELVARIDDLDADRARVDIGLAAPGRDTGMPGTPLLGHQAEDPAILLHHVVSADPGRCVAQAIERRRAGRHAGVMEDQHVDRRAIRPRVVVGRKPLDHGVARSGDGLAMALHI